MEEFGDVVVSMLSILRSRGHSWHSC